MIAGNVAIPSPAARKSTKDPVQEEKQRGPVGRGGRGRKGGDYRWERGGHLSEGARYFADCGNRGKNVTFLREKGGAKVLGQEGWLSKWGGA